MCRSKPWRAALLGGVADSRPGDHRRPNRDYVSDRTPDPSARGARPHPTLARAPPFSGVGRSRRWPKLPIASPWPGGARRPGTHAARDAISSAQRPHTIQPCPCLAVHSLLSPCPCTHAVFRSSPRDPIRSDNTRQARCASRASAGLVKATPRRNQYHANVENTDTSFSFSFTSPMVQ